MSRIFELWFALWALDRASRHPGAVVRWLVIVIGLSLLVALVRANAAPLLALLGPVPVEWLVMPPLVYLLLHILVFGLGRKRPAE